MWWEVRGYGRLHGSGPGWFVPLWGIQAPGLHSKHLSKEPNWSIIMRYYKGQFQKFYSGTNNMYKNSTKRSSKEDLYFHLRISGRYGYEPNSSIVDCVCDTTLLFLWCPVLARADWLADCYLQCDWLRPGRARRQGSAEDGALHLRSQRHKQGAKSKGHFRFSMLALLCFLFVWQDIY